MPIIPGSITPIGDIGRRAQTLSVHLHHALRHELDHLPQQIAVGAVGSQNLWTRLGLIFSKPFPPLG